jgi:hypothetical protein
MSRFSDREKALILLSGVTLFTLGVWAGVWIVPDAALDVPVVDSPGRGPHLAFQPVPTWLPLMSVLALLGATYGAHVILRDDPPVDGGERL